MPPESAVIRNNRTFATRKIMVNVAGRPRIARAKFMVSRSGPGRSVSRLVAGESSAAPHCVHSRSPEGTSAPQFRHTPGRPTYSFSFERVNAKARLPPQSTKHLLTRQSPCTLHHGDLITPETKVRFQCRNEDECAGDSTLKVKLLSFSQHCGSSSPPHRFSGPRKCFYFSLPNGRTLNFLLTTPSKSMTDPVQPDRHNWLANHWPI